MSDRLTNKWTANTEAAFGEKGKRGRTGEVFVMEYLSEQGLEVVDHENDRKVQLSGIDLSFRATANTPYQTIDVKHNVNPQYTFWVEADAKGWLAKSSADWIYHVNVDKGAMAWYNPVHMRQHVQEEKLYGQKLVSFQHLDSPAFVTWKFNVKR